MPNTYDGVGKKEKKLKVILLLLYLETLWNDSNGHIYKL